MTNLPLPLRRANDTEALRTWEDIKTPDDLINYIVAHFAVEADGLARLMEIYRGPIAPSGDDLGKLWLKTNNPVGIGVYNGAGYEIIYQYPPNVPLLWTQGSSAFPSYLYTLTEEDLTNFGLTNPTGGFYFMLKV
jgi:hypothetical protein